MPVIANSSHLIQHLRATYPSQVLQLAWCLFMIVIAAHWMACLWCFVVYAEVGSFSEHKMLAVPNWIANWYTLNGGAAGGINPLGWQNSVSRYALCLMWSAQTLTSIGYGNVVPLTLAEWFVNSALQLTAGIM